MTEDTETYYRRRSTEEQTAADRATDQGVADIHRSLAARYSALAGQPKVWKIDEDRPLEPDAESFRQAKGAR